MRRLVCLFAVLFFVMAAKAIHAQQAAAPKTQPETQQPTTDVLPAGAQQPGAGAQVHTGTSSGLDTDTRLENLLADHQFIRIEGELNQLPALQAQFYRGILANRNNDLKKSIELLEPLVDDVAASGDARHEKLLRKALAEDYLREGDWAKASAAYQAIETRLNGKLGSDEQDEIEMPLKMLPLAQGYPPMTVDPCAPFKLQVNKNPLGLTDIPVFVDARPQSWMLDPTASFNLIARSLAKEAGLTVSADAATIHTLTGRPIEVHATVIPRFTIGGQLTLRNMTAFVYEDKDFFFPQTHYQVEGVLGYAALQAIGSLTVTDSDTIYVRPEKQIAPEEKGDKLMDGVRFFLDGDQVIVALGGASGGDDRMFAIDAGGQQTYLTSRYYDEHSSDFTGQKMQLYTLRGQAGIAPDPAYIAETIPLTVGTTTVQVHYIPVLTQPLGSAALDDVYGLLGVDALDQVRSYTFDYRTMRFSAKQE
ncbi:MAG TPA: retropepsin-like aspartic protease [Terracidiphilus sp.]|nr:retropepsin-like aspartic protease [Terracidiphilus sp.]